MHAESALRQQKDSGKEWGYRTQDRELAHSEQSTTSPQDSSNYTERQKIDQDFVE